MGSVGESSKGNQRARRGLLTGGAVAAGAAMLATACASGSAAPRADRSPDGRTGMATPTASASSAPVSSKTREFSPTAAQRREFGPTFTLVLQDIGALGVQASRLPESVMHRPVSNTNGRVGRQWDLKSAGEEMEITVVKTTSSEGKVVEDVYTSTSNEQVQRTSDGPELPADDEFSFSEQAGTGVPDEVYVKLSGQGSDTEFSLKPGEAVNSAERAAIRIADAAMNAVADQALHPLPG